MNSLPGHVIGAGMAVEILAIGGVATEEERDAVMGPGYDQGDAACAHAGQAVVAPGVAQENGLVAPRRVHRVDHGLHVGHHVVRFQVVQALAEELDVHLRGRRGRQPARLAVDDLAPDELQFPLCLAGRQI